MYFCSNFPKNLFFPHIDFRTITNVPESNGVSDTSPIDEDDFHPIKRRRSSSQGDQTKMLENIAQSMKENSSKRNELIEKLLSGSQRSSELELFFSSICKTVERLCWIDQARLKLKISQLVNEAEMAHIEKLELGTSTQMAFLDGSTFAYENVTVEK